MSKIVFVPLTDEMVFERPELIAGPITAYQPTMLKKSHVPGSTKESCRASRAYLEGDLVNGFNVVYVGDKPRISNNAKKYRDFKRGIWRG